jgi:hypothetical protein
MKNPFVQLMMSRGFIQGVSGRFVSPDCKYGKGIAVEVSDTGTTAVAFFEGGRTLYEVTSQRDMTKFENEIY